MGSILLPRRDRDTRFWRLEAEERTSGSVSLSGSSSLELHDHHLRTGGTSLPDLAVVECQGDDVVEQEVRVLQGELPSPHQDDEMLHWRKVLAVLQADAEGECLRLTRSADNEILKQNICNLYTLPLAEI